MDAVASTLRNDVSREGIRQALIGAHIADALGFPLHWYYTLEYIQRDMQSFFSGRIDRYYDPPAVHPDSWNYFQHWKDMNVDIRHDKAPLWSIPGTHYHGTLHAGDNTHNLLVLDMILDSCIDNGRYNQDDYLDRYIRFFMEPGANPDIYIEMFHRHFFEKLKEGIPRTECGMPDETCISSIVLSLPTIFLNLNASVDEQQKAFREHIFLTHRAEHILYQLRILAKVFTGVHNAAPEARLSTARELIEEAFYAIWLGEEMLDDLFPVDEQELFLSPSSKLSPR